MGILICYYGAFPWYFRFFLQSCATNPDIDFIFITDIPVPGKLPPNVKLAPYSLADIRDAAAQALSFPVSLNDPYKLCDFRPAYGLLFEDLLKEYDFWGYGDIDVIYGKIRHIITDEVLQQYDIISARKEYLSGFFALYRNNEKIRHLFRESRDYQKVFQDPAHYCFDETNWYWSEVMDGKSIFQLNQHIQSMTYVVKKGALNGSVRLYAKTLVEERCSELLKWDNGSLWRGHEEVILYHLIQFKGLSFRHVPRWEAMPARFYMYNYYFSTIHPRSFPGRVKHQALNTLQFLHKKGIPALQYLVWLSMYMMATKKCKSRHLPFLQQIPGTYKWGKDRTVRVSLANGSLLAQWGQRSLNLFHLGNNRFLTSKFSVSDSVNVIIEFHYDKSNATCALHITPFRKATQVLMKVNE